MPPLRLRLIVLAAALFAGGVALGWSPGTEGADAQSSHHEIQAIVTDEDGRPVDGLSVGAHVYRGGPGVYQAKRTATGAARFLLVEGVYRLHIYTDQFSKCTVWGIENPEGRPHAVFTAQPGASSRIEIVVSRGDPPATRTWIPCRFDVPFYRIRGSVSGPRGEPIEGIAVQAFGDWEGNYGPWSALRTDAEGRLGIEVPDGAFSLSLSLEFADGGRCDLGYFGSDGRRTPLRELTRLVVAGDDVEGFAITLSDLPSTLCQRVEGIVVDAEDKPVARSEVTFGEWEPKGAWTDAAGTFGRYLREGSYLVQVRTDLGDECTVEGYERAALGRPARIDVDGEGVDGLRIALSGDAGAGLKNLICFFPPAMATTTLRPGWNLAGWTAEETDAGALFEAIPTLDAVHAWEAETQSFARPARDDSEGAADLTTIAPGMGLWLHLGGEEPVTWTRSVAPTGGFVSLQPGWNLVAWAGRDGAAPKDAFAFLGDDLLAAAAWDVGANEFRLHYPEAPREFNTLRRLERGEALWLNMSASRRWLQPGATSSSVEFVGEVAPETRANIVPRVDDVMAYFAERTGFFVPGLTVSVGQHPVCADYGSGFRTIRLAEDCVVAIAHEYTHAVQFTAGGGRTATWLVEGVAERWSAQYYDYVGAPTYEDHLRDVAIRQARFAQARLEEMESHAGFKAQAGRYGLVHLAADWLASIGGGDHALFDYFDARTNEEDWQVTFERVFGIGVDDFYASFAAERADLAPPHPRVEGSVRKPDGAPLVGATVHARSVRYGNVRTVTTGDDGAFALVLERGAYDLWVTVDGCPLPWSSGGFPVKAVTGHSSRLELEGGIVADLVITPTATAADTCRWRWIRGVVTDLAGNPRDGIRVHARTWVDSNEVETSTRDWTAEDGLFALRVIEGRYRLSVRVGSMVSNYERQRGLTLLSPNATPIVVGATDVSDIAIQFGIISGVIGGLSADHSLQLGLQEGNHRHFRQATPGFQFIAPTGTFLLGVYCSNFRLVGWYGGDNGLVTDRSQAAPIVLDDADVTLTLDIPAAVTCQ